MSINDFLDDDQTPDSVTQSDATEVDAVNDFFDAPIVNASDDTVTYPEEAAHQVEGTAALVALESIREDLTGLVRDTETAIPQTEFVVDVNLDDDSKTLLDDDLANVIASDPQLLGSLESISLLDERSAKTIIEILDDKIAELKK